MNTLKKIIVFTVVVPLAGGMVASLVYLLSLIFGGA